MFASAALSSPSFSSVGEISLIGAESLICLRQDRARLPASVSDVLTTRRTAYAHSERRTPFFSAGRVHLVQQRVIQLWGQDGAQEYQLHHPAWPGKRVAFLACVCCRKCECLVFRFPLSRPVHPTWPNKGKFSRVRVCKKVRLSFRWRAPLSVRFRPGAKPACPVFHHLLWGTKKGMR